MEDAEHLHPDIGILVRGGQTIYYCYKGGEYHERGSVPAINAVLFGYPEPTPEVVPPAVEASLPQQKKPEGERAYLVEVKKKYPAWDDKPFDVAVDAANAKEAESKARKHVASQCLFTRMDGAILYKARRAEE